MSIEEKLDEILNIDKETSELGKELKNNTKQQILELIKQARIDEICTVDTDSQGKDYIRFFDGSEPCYTVTDFWNRLNQLKEDK